MLFEYIIYMNVFDLISVICLLKPCW